MPVFMAESKDSLISSSDSLSVNKMIHGLSEDEIKDTSFIKFALSILLLHIVMCHILNNQLYA